MSQHSFSIANMARSLFRAAVNDALQALASNNKGSSQPATRYPGMTWIDDSATPWVEKRWTGSAWVVSGYINASTGIWTPAGANSIDPGICVEYYGNAAPAGWLFPYGQAVSRSTYSALYSALGTQHGGGDGATTFNLPDRRDRMGIGRGDMGGTPAGVITAGVTGLNTAILGAKGGAQSSSDLPSHGHNYWRTIIDPSGNFHPDNFTYVQAVNLGDPGALGVRYQSEGSGAAGGAASFSILPPGIVCNYLIKT